jgi:4-hydroxybenzoate polyprenyltransferase
VPAVAGLLAAAHLGPSLVVTVVTGGLGVAAGLGGGRLALLVTAVLLGQLSIGWSNDWIDGRAGRDGERADKPVSTGAIGLHAVGTAALAAAVLTVVASFALGPVPGGLHVLAVASGWAYNAGLKSTPASIAPYLLSFGLLPAIASAAAGGHPLAWAVTVAALFGGGVHLANALPDLAVDARTGVRGLPQRMGPRRTALGASVLLGSGAVVTALAEAAVDGWTPSVVVALVVPLALVVATAALGLRGAHEAAFKTAMLAGLVVVGLLVARGGAI